MGNFLGCTGDDSDDSISKAQRRACRNLNTAVNKLGVRPTEKTVRDAEKAAENLLNAMMEGQDAAEARLLDQLSKVDETQAGIFDTPSDLGSFNFQGIGVCSHIQVDSSNPSTFSITGTANGTTTSGTTTGGTGTGGTGAGGGGGGY